MQAVFNREEEMVIGYLKKDTAEIVHLSMPGALPAGQMLALNFALGTLSCIATSDHLPQLMVQQQFTTSELSVLLPLLESYPHYCPYEVLYASFYNGTVTDLIVARCRQRLQRALELGTWEQELRPLRNVLSRTRINLRNFGFNVTSILETGCILMAAPSWKPIAKA